MLTEVTRTFQKDCSGGSGRRSTSDGTDWLKGVMIQNHISLKEITVAGHEDSPVHLCQLYFPSVLAHPLLPEKDTADMKQRSAARRATSHKTHRELELQMERDFSN